MPFPDVPAGLHGSAGKSDGPCFGMGHLVLIGMVADKLIGVMDDKITELCDELETRYEQLKEICDRDMMVEFDYMMFDDLTIRKMVEQTEYYAGIECDYKEIEHMVGRMLKACDDLKAGKVKDEASFFELVGEMMDEFGCEFDYDDATDMMIYADYAATNTMTAGTECLCPELNDGATDGALN
jgi:hypothetical protein